MKRNVRIKMKIRYIIMWLPALWLFVTFSNASEVSYAPLASVMKEAQCIFQAKVLNVERNITPEGSRVEYLVEPMKVLKGILSIPSKARLSYFEATPVIKDQNGQVITRISPIFSGSGEEFSIEANQEWFFLLVTNQLPEEQTIAILRAEPVTKNREIRKILSQQDNSHEKK